MYRVPPDHYHITLFTLSRPEDPRPNPIIDSSGCDTSLPPRSRPGVRSHVMLKETKMTKSIVENLSPPVLRLHSIFMADSGTLLATWIDESGSIFTFRNTMRDAFPGASAWQPSIIHCSLCRILTVAPLDKTTISKVSNICSEWTARLHGKVFMPQRAWLVYHNKLMSTEGQQFDLFYR